jgi:uncharacterized protein YbjT (DUF2867 family)
MSFRYRVATVFGGSGFIGRHLIRRLAKTGSVIRVAVRHPSHANFLRTNGSVGQIVPIAGNVLSDESVAAAVRDADLVINLVGILSETSRASFQAIHVEAPGRIARLAKEAGAGRMVHMSALGADANSASAYARSKAAGEEAVRAAFPEATILRPSLVFGPEDNFFNRFASLARILPVLPLFGGGHTRFQPVYVGDVADAIMAALTNPACQGKTYELGGPRVYTYKEIMELVLHEIRRRRYLLSNPMLTRDQVEMLKVDNVPAAGAPGLKELGVTPTAAEVILPTYMDRFLIGGRYSTQGQTGGMPSTGHEPR